MVQVSRALANFGNLSNLTLEFENKVASEQFRRISESIELLPKLRKITLELSKYPPSLTQICSEGR